MEICLRKLSVVLKVVGKYDSKKRDAAGACVSQITNESFQNEPAFSNPLARVID